LRVQSPAGAGPLQWLAGLFYLSSDLHTDSGSTQFVPAQVLPVPAPLALPPVTGLTLADSLNRTYAAFGQATATFGQHLSLTAGLRLTYDDCSISRAGTVVSSSQPVLANGGYHLARDFTSPHPNFAVTWHFTPQLEAYASATEGYQSGGFNPSASVASLSAYSPERSWQFELG